MSNLIVVSNCPRCGRLSPAPGAWCGACLDVAWPVQRYPATLRWARRLGWVQIRDPFTGEQHEIAAKDAPRSWLDELRGRRKGKATR